MSKTKPGSLKRLIEIDKPLARVTKDKGEEKAITSIGMKQTTSLQTADIMKEYYD